MFTLNLDLVAHQGGDAGLSSFYRDVFYPAISKQPGFARAQLLVNKVGELRTHRLVISFDSEELQQQWVATQLHDEVSSKLMKLIAKVCSADALESDA